VAVKGELLPSGHQTVAELAAVANRQHELAREAGEEMIMHAFAAGEALIAVKAQLQHGEWLPWLAANFSASEDTAQLYMRVARNTERVRYLEEPSLRKAVAATTTQRDAQPRLMPAVAEGEEDEGVYMFPPGTEGICPTCHGSGRVPLEEGGRDAAEG
jgi:hypothetical protein